MKLYVIGVNYRTAPLQIREKFSIDNQEHERLLSEIKLLDGITECALLSTCNRTELHVFSDSAICDTGYIESCFCDLKGIDIYNVKKYFYVYEGIKAVEHIFKVASGMDSMILGEDQILGQFKRAYEISMKKGTSKAVLNTLSRLAITASKKIKTRNIMVGKVSSVAGQVGELLKRVYGKELHAKNVLIIGSGEVGKMIFDELLQIGVADIHMTKRSRPGDEAAANKNNVSKEKYISYNDRYLYIDKCDVVISATSSPHYTITRDILEEITCKDRKHIFIDLAVPRDIDETICQIENVYLYNIDDLKSYTGKKDKFNYQLDVDYIQEQISSHIDEFIKWFQFRNAFCCKEA